MCRLILSILGLNFGEMLFMLRERERERTDCRCDGYDKIMGTPTRWLTRQGQHTKTTNEDIKPGCIVSLRACVKTCWVFETQCIFFSLWWWLNIWHRKWVTWIVAYGVRFSSLLTTHQQSLLRSVDLHKAASAGTCQFTKMTQLENSPPWVWINFQEVNGLYFIKIKLR